MNVDVDSHFTPPEIYKDIPREFRDAPRLILDHENSARLVVAGGERSISFSSTNFSLKVRIDAMKEAGYDKQCLNVALQSLATHWVSPETELYLVKAWNDAVSKIVEKNDCFIGVAQVPHRDPQAAIEEARRCVEDLGFSAIHVEGNWAGRNIESYDWWPFFEAVEKLDVPIFSHPTGGAADGVFNPHLAGHEYFENFIPAVSQLLAFVIQHEISMSGLVFSGILDRFPKLKFVWLETDVGWVPPFMEMLDGIYDAHLMYKASGVDRVLRGKSPVDTVKLKKKPSRYFRENYFYSINYGSELQLKVMLPLLIEKLQMGKHVMIQSDFDHPEGSLDIVRTLRQMTEINDEAKEDICGRNASDILKVKWAPSPVVWS